MGFKPAECRHLKQQPSFQKVARQVIQAQFSPFHFENRTRHKLCRWKLEGPEAIVARRACSNFELLKVHCRPCVVSAYLRTLFNGWPTTERMRSMKDVQIRACVLGCLGAKDNIEHYSRCPRVWALLRKSRPSGLGLDECHRSLEGFLMVSRGMRQEEKLAMSVAVYAVCRTVMQARDCLNPPATEPLLRLHIKEGLRGSKARKILMAVRTE